MCNGESPEAAVCRHVNKVANSQRKMNHQNAPLWRRRALPEALRRERAFHLALKFTAISVSEVELMHFINIKPEAVVSYVNTLHGRRAVKSIQLESNGGRARVQLQERLNLICTVYTLMVNSYQEAFLICIYGNSLERPLVVNSDEALKMVNMQKPE